MAASVSRSRSSGPACRGLFTALPMLAVTTISRPSRTNGALNAAWIRAATATAASPLATSSMMSANSSPSRRAREFAGAQAAGQTRAHLDQQRIARGTAEGGIDGAETVEVYEQGREPVLRAPLAAGEMVCQAILKKVAVGQAGERVVHRRLPASVFDGARRGHVAADGEHAKRLAGGVA